MVLLFRHACAHSEATLSRRRICTTPRRTRRSVAVHRHSFFRWHSNGRCHGTGAATTSGGVRTEKFSACRPPGRSASNDSRLAMGVDVVETATRVGVDERGVHVIAERAFGRHRHGLILRYQRMSEKCESTREACPYCYISWVEPAGCCSRNVNAMATNMSSYPSISS
jgi:hypothetical protein